MQLEDELGVQLFKRGKHSIVLTEDGMILKQRAREMVLLENKIKSELTNEKVLMGLISIGSGEFFEMKTVSDLVSEFQKKNPQVKFDVYSGIADDIKDKIERGTVDIGILSEPVDISKYEFIRLLHKQHWGVLIKSEDDLAKKEYITPDDLKDIPLIMAKRESVRNEVAHWFGDMYNNLNIAANCDLIYNTECMVMGGIGAAVTIDSVIKNEGLSFVRLYPQIETGSVLVWKKQRVMPQALDEFIKYVKKCFKENN